MYTSSYYDGAAVAGSAVGGMLAGMIIVIIVVCLIALALSVLQIIGTWKILKKAGQPGWGSIIPIYNQYLLCKISGVNPWWILIVFLSSILSIIPVIGSIAVFAISIYFTILLNVSVARSFGKEDGYAVGLILLAPIFYFILGIKDDEYQGEKPMNDFVFDKLGIAKATNSSTEQKDFSSSKDAKFCSSCGAKVDKDTKFCPGCGASMK